MNCLFKINFNKTVSHGVRYFHVYPTGINNFFLEGFKHYLPLKSAPHEYTIGQILFSYSFFNPEKF